MDNIILEKFRQELLNGDSVLIAKSIHDMLDQLP